MSTKKTWSKWTKAEIKIVKNNTPKEALKLLPERGLQNIYSLRNRLGIKIKGSGNGRDYSNRAKLAWETRRGHKNNTMTTASNKKELNFLINGTQVVIDKGVTKARISKQGIEVTF